MNNNIITSDRANVLLDRMLDLSFKRQGVIANNMANASTPNYIRKDVEFEETLKKTLELGDGSDLERLRMKTVEDLSSAPGSDGNNVHVSKELNHMMQNGLQYDLANKVLMTKIRILKAAIK